MGQQLFKIALNNDLDQSEINLSDDDKDDIAFFTPLKLNNSTSDADESINECQITNDQSEQWEKIRNYLSEWTKSNSFEEFSKETTRIMLEDILPVINNQSIKQNEDYEKYVSSNQQLQCLLKTKTENDDNLDYSFFSIPSNDTEDSQDNVLQQQSNQLSYFGIQSLISVLLVLFKSAEKHDPTIVQQILMLTSQLCEQLPIKCLSTTNYLIFKALQPITNYISDLSLINDENTSKQAIKILLNFFLAKGSLKDILPLIDRLLFNTTEKYEITGVMKQLNTGLNRIIKQWMKESNPEMKDDLKIEEHLSLNYLKSIGSYPNDELLKINSNLFTGQFISSILLSHIDIHSDFSILQNLTDLSSLSCEFHPKTFENLFSTLEKLSTQYKFNVNIKHVFTIYLKLFRNHLKILSNLKTNDSFDLNSYTNDDELEKWSAFSFQIVYDNDQQDNRISQEASKCLLHLLDIRESSFIKRLNQVFEYIKENKYPMLIEQCFIYLNRVETLKPLVDILCQDDSDNFSEINILFFIIDRYSDNDDIKYKNEMENFLSSIQKALLCRLIAQCEINTCDNNQCKITSQISQYVTYVLKKFQNKCLVSNDFLNSIFVGLYSMTVDDTKFTYNAIEPIFIPVLPLLAEFITKNHDNFQFLASLIGRIVHKLIIGSPLDALEQKHASTLKLPIFAGGSIVNTKENILNSDLASYAHYKLPIDSSDDNELLMSIYNNTNQGAEFLLKVKEYNKVKQRLLQKSIEQPANEAFGQVLAVYIKLYRRINVVKSELLKSNETRIHKNIVKLCNYANRVYTLFTTVKGQGGDCTELHEKIKEKTLFILTFIQESNLIPIDNDDDSFTINIKNQQSQFKYQRQPSRWSKAKHVLKLLRYLFQACLRFKKFMIEKKQYSQQIYDYENLLNHTIDNFIYGDFQTTPTVTTDNNKRIDIDELKVCLTKQSQRTMVRLITYRFVKIFLEKITQIENKDLINELLLMYIRYLRQDDSEWSYLHNITALNNQMTNEISDCYYSIVKLIFLIDNQSMGFKENIFYLINLPYESTDICHIYNYQFMEDLFKSFISFNQNSNENLSINSRLISFNWFRLFTFKLCEIIKIDKLRHTPNQIFQKILRYALNKLVLNEFKDLRRIYLSLNEDAPDKTNDSLKHCELKWFIEAKRLNKTTLSTRLDIEQFLNQYLILLLQCTYYYHYILPLYSTVEFLEELLSLYHCCQTISTRLLIIRLFRCIILHIPDNSDGSTKTIIESFLIECLNAIGQPTNSQDIVSELVHMYRKIASVNSNWQQTAVKLLLNKISSYLNIKIIDDENQNEVNQVLASLNILGGYIEPCRLGSIVKLLNNDDFNDESIYGLIIDIDSTSGDMNSSYTIRYLHTNKIESVQKDKLQLENDVLLPNSSMIDDTFFDTLCNFIQIDTNLHHSLPLLLQLKRRAIATLCHLLNDRKFADILITKANLSNISKLCLANSLENECPKELQHFKQFNRQHFEQYSLILDRCELTKQFVKSEKPKEVEVEAPIQDQRNLSWNIWTTNSMKPDESIVDTLSLSSFAYNEWKPYVSEVELENFRRGLVGGDDISVVSIPSKTVRPEAIQQCGTKHVFGGRVAPTGNNTESNFPTFTIENLQVSEGNWYYCIRLPEAGVIQIGWATNKFAPHGGCGVGDDEYSWSYDGSRGVLFNNSGFYSQFDDIRWKENDVCGCGIEIDGKNTTIKYWLNGKLLGTAFSHDTYIPMSTTKCNLLPHGSNTTYYPAISIQWASDPLRYFEFILSPEDMQNCCPLPNGYKPLLLPKLLRTENSIVDFPCSAYLVGDNKEDTFVLTKEKGEKVVLRDCISSNHLETSCNVDDQHLILSDKSQNFTLPISNVNVSSLTVSFDCHILPIEERKLISIFRLGTMEILWDRTDDYLRCAIVFLSKKRLVKAYVNNKCFILNNDLEHETMEQLQLILLPEINAKMKNLAIWKYALSEDQISRLFTYNLFFISKIYQEIKLSRKIKNKISFEKNQQTLPESIVLFDEPFTEDLMQEKKRLINCNQKNYFKSHENKDYSTIELYGNETYLVLEKADTRWKEYCFILEMLIANYPTENGQITILSLSSNCEIYLTHEGTICLKINNTKVFTESKVNLNEYFRLFISYEESVKIYLNDKLEIDYVTKSEACHITQEIIYLFREKDPAQNTIDNNQLRLSFKSLKFCNRSITFRQIDKFSFEDTLVSMTYQILSQMGYKKAWIGRLIKKYKTNDIFLLNRVLCEEKEQLIKQDMDDEKSYYITIFKHLNPSIDTQRIVNQISSDKNETLKALIQEFLKSSISSSSSSKMGDTNLKLTKISKENWFNESCRHLNISYTFNEWTRDRDLADNDENKIYKLLESNKKQKENNKNQISIGYPHENMTFEQFSQSRALCEYGLIGIYSCYAMLNLFKHVSFDESKLIPIENLGDYKFLIVLFQLLDSIEDGTDKTSNGIIQFIQLKLRLEFKQLLKFQDEINHEILEKESPLLYHLQDYIFSQFLTLIIQPTLLNRRLDEKIYKTVNFIFKIFNIFLQILKDKSVVKQQQQINLLFNILFSQPCLQLVFDILLIYPVHHVKVKIINLFQSLIQINDNFVLDSEIQQFMINLLIEITSKQVVMDEYSMKRFQLALADLLFLLKNKYKTETTMEKELDSKLSDDILDLYTTVDLVNHINEQSTDKVLSPRFYSKSKHVLNENLKLTENDILESRQPFNFEADFELINFMNENLLTYESFEKFVEKLPKGTETNPTFYAKYSLLSTISCDFIQKRSRLLYLLNKLITSCLPLIDLNLPPEQSYLTDRIRAVKLYLLSATKFEMFNESLNETQTSYSCESNAVAFDTVKASNDSDNYENTMFYQAFKQLNEKASVLFRQPNDQLWYTQYLGMHSTDHGGPYRDSITRICWDICSTKLKLFVLCPNGRVNTGSNRDCWIPNTFPPNKPIGNKLKRQYRFVGQLLGMAIRKKHYLNLKFAPLFWKKLLNEQIDIEDVEAIDVQSFTFIKEMEKNIDDMKSIDSVNDIESVFSSIMSDLQFDVVASNGQTYELVPGGKEMPITANNFKHYCSSYRQYRLNEFNRQINYIREGLHNIVPSYYLSLFSARELEEAVCGKDKIDIGMLKRNTYYGGEFNSDSTTILHLWRVLEEMFNEEQRKLFLIFVWGRSTLPCRDEEFQSKFSIQPLDVDEARIDTALPRSHTCFFTIDLPAYSTAEIMCERLTYAITNCSSIDGDGTMNELRNIRDSDSSDSSEE